MVQHRIFSGRSGLWAAAAVGSFAGLAVLSAIPALPPPLKEISAVIGYVALVLLLGRALRAWRSDWSELWFLPPAGSQKRKSARGSEPLDFRRPRRHRWSLRS